MKRSTLIDRIDDHFETTEALSSNLQQFLSPPIEPQQDANDIPLVIEPLDAVADDVEDEVGIHLHLWATAHVINDCTQIIEKKTMGNWTDNELVPFVMETHYDDNQQEIYLLLSDKILEMAPPSTASQDFPIEKISFHGERHEFSFYRNFFLFRNYTTLYLTGIDCCGICDIED